MAYKGLIKKSRTYDLTALSQLLDVAAPVFILYSPEQLGITVPVYMGLRILINWGAVALRKRTTGPVGVK